ncbi:MAG: hypothetical protein ACKO3H_06790 [Verrucomicrobiota bacterium]
MELRFGSDPTKKDTDGDGWDDKAEFDAKTLPRNKDSFPLFTLLAKDQQLLANDLLVLRVRILTNGIVTTNLTVVTNETPVPSASRSTPMEMASMTDAISTVTVRRMSPVPVRRA